MENGAKLFDWDSPNCNCDHNPNPNPLKPGAMPVAPLVQASRAHQSIWYMIWSCTVSVQQLIVNALLLALKDSDNQPRCSLQIQWCGSLCNWSSRWNIRDKHNVESMKKHLIGADQSDRDFIFFPSKLEADLEQETSLFREARVSLLFLLLFLFQWAETLRHHNVWNSQIYKFHRNHFSGCFFKDLNPGLSIHISHNWCQNLTDLAHLVGHPFVTERSAHTLVKPHPQNATSCFCCLEIQRQLIVDKLSKPDRCLSVVIINVKGPGIRTIKEKMSFYFKTRYFTIITLSFIQNSPFTFQNMDGKNNV